MSLIWKCATRNLVFICLLDEFPHLYSGFYRGWFPSRALSSSSPINLDIICDFIEDDFPPELFLRPPPINLDIICDFIDDDFPPELFLRPPPSTWILYVRYTPIGIFLSGNFPRLFSLVAFSQEYFSKWRLPKCTISQAATSKGYFPKRQLPKSVPAAAFGPKHVLAAALRSLVHPTRSALEGLN